MSRLVKVLTFETNELIELKEIASGSLNDPWVRKKAQMLLALAGADPPKKTLKEVISEFGVAKNTLYSLRDAFLEKRIAAVYNGERPGRGGAAKDERKAKVLDLYEQSVQDGTKIKASEIANRIGMSTASVQAVLRSEGITGERIRQWYVGCSESPIPKSTDIVGLYLTRDCCIMTVATNTSGLLPALSGCLRTRNHALSSRVESAVENRKPTELNSLIHMSLEHLGTSAARHRTVDGSEFLSTLMRNMPSGTEYEYCVMIYRKDGYKITVPGKGPSIRTEFFQTQDDWLKAVGMMFKVFRKKGADITAEDLTTEARAFLQKWSESDEPFFWLKRAEGAFSMDEMAHECEKESQSIPFSQDGGAESESSDHYVILRTTIEMVKENGEIFSFSKELPIDMPSLLGFNTTDEGFYADFDKGEEMTSKLKDVNKEFYQSYLDASGKKN